MRARSDSTYGLKSVFAKIGFESSTLIATPLQSRFTREDQRKCAHFGFGKEAKQTAIYLPTVCQAPRARGHVIVEKFQADIFVISSFALLPCQRSMNATTFVSGFEPMIPPLSAMKKNFACLSRGRTPRLNSIKLQKLHVRNNRKYFSTRTPT